MKHLFCILTFICFHGLSIHAQEPLATEAMKNINQIKLDTCYIWAEGTSVESETQAIENAQSVLGLEVQDWIAKNGLSDVAGVMMPTKDQCQNIQTKRGKLFRAFVYVHKGMVVPYMKDEKAVIVEKIYTPTPFEQQMLQVKKAKDIESFVKQDTISKYGKYKVRPQTGTYYLLLYNREGEVPACLKFDNGTLTNVATGEEDTFDNYKGCGAYWFIVK